MLKHQFNAWLNNLATARGWYSFIGIGLTVFAGFAFAEANGCTFLR